MNPVEVLESRGWYNDNKRFKAVKSGNVWKLTLKDNGVLKGYTQNYITDELHSTGKFKVLHTTFKNAAMPTYISCDINSNPPKRYNYMTMTIQELEYSHDFYKVREITIYPDNIDGYSVQFSRKHVGKYYAHVTLSSQKRLEQALRNTPIYHQCPHFTQPGIFYTEYKF